MPCNYSDWCILLPSQHNECWQIRTKHCQQGINRNPPPVSARCCKSRWRYLQCERTSAHWLRKQEEGISLLCIGLRNHQHNNDEQDNPLFSIQGEPWSLLPKTSFLRPKNTDYVYEITLCARLFNLPSISRPRNWTRGQSLSGLKTIRYVMWLMIESLSNKVRRVQEVLRRATQDQQQHNLVAGECSSALSRSAGSGGGGGGGRNWQGSVLYLCLTLYTANTDHKLYLKVLLDLWNSSQINPIALASDSHFDFLTAKDCSFEHVAGFAQATPTRMEDIVVSMRSDVQRIITRW